MLKNKFIVFIIYEFKCNKSLFLKDRFRKYCRFYEKSLIAWRFIVQLNPLDALLSLWRSRETYISYVCIRNKTGDSTIHVLMG